MGCVCGVCAKEDETRFDGTRSFDMYFERSLSLSSLKLQFEKKNREEIVRDERSRER